MKAYWREREGVRESQGLNRNVYGFTVLWTNDATARFAFKIVESLH